ncbi:hypothetical protein D3C81_873230 [compost metagenome]
MIDGMDLPEPVKQALGAAAATSIGVAAGGGAGAATAFNTDVNNRMLHPGDRQKAKALAELSKGKYTEKQILDAMRYSGLRDEAGNIVVAENTQETFVRNVDIQTGKTIQEILKADNTMPVVSIPGDQITLLEKAPTRPSNDLMTFIQENTGGSTSAYLFTKAPTYTNTPSPVSTARCVTAECAAGVLPSKPNAGRDTQLAGALQATGGTLQAGVGGTMVYGGLSTCIPSLGVGCGVAAVGLYLGLSGVDTAVSGGISVYDKKVHRTVGGSLIQMTGLSPETSELIYAGTQIGAGFSAPRLLQTTNVSNLATKAGATAQVGEVAGASTVEPTVSLFGYRGAGSTKDLLSVEAPHPYVVTGHVGYSFDGGKTIYGFGPKVPSGMSGYEAVQSLRNGERYPGIITNDTAVFESVARNPTMGRGGVSQVVIEQKIPVSEAQLNAIKANHERIGVGNPMDNVLYGFRGQNACTFNCATFPSSLGIPTPEASGYMRNYMPLLENLGQPWKPR